MVMTNKCPLDRIKKDLIEAIHKMEKKLKSKFKGIEIDDDTRRFSIIFDLEKDSCYDPGRFELEVGNRIGPYE